MEVGEQIKTLRTEILDTQHGKAGKRVHYPLRIRERVRKLREAGLQIRRLAQELGLREVLVRSWCQKRAADAPQVFTVRDGAELDAKAPRPAEVVQLRIGALTVTLEMGGA